MEIAQLLSEEDICLDLPVKGKRSALAKIAGRLAMRYDLAENTVLDRLLIRETLGSTGLGHGVAIPHAFMAELSTPVVSLSRLSRPIDFEAPDEDHVDLVFTILWPQHDKSAFLPALASICRFFRSSPLRKRLRVAQSAAEVVAVIDFTSQREQSDDSYQATSGRPSGRHDPEYRDTTR